MPQPPESSSVNELRITPVESEAAWQAATSIRRRVFIEEQDCPPEEEFDAHDAESRHLVGYAGDQAVAAARWRAVRLEDGTPAAKLERFAVLPPARGQGYGRALVERTLSEAEQAGLRTQVIHAQTHLEAFYADFGFKRQDAPFMEAGISHVKMVRRPE